MYFKKTIIVNVFLSSIYDDEKVVSLIKKLLEYIGGLERGDRGGRKVLISLTLRRLINQLHLKKRYLQK